MKSFEQILSRQNNRYSSSLKLWRTITSRDIIEELPWLKLSVESVLLPNGQKIDNFYQVQLPEYAVIVALTEDGQIIMEREYKHALKRIVLNLPAGYLDSNEKPLVCAKRELLEETGFVADDWLLLGCFLADGNRGCGKAHLYVARYAHQVTEPDPGHLEELETYLMEPANVVEAIRCGEVPLLATVTAIMLAINAGYVSLSPER